MISQVKSAYIKSKLKQLNIEWSIIKERLFLRIKALSVEKQF